MIDVLIVGSGPAGLSAALVLGRSRRSVVLVDSGEPRSAVSQAMHGFLTRDGISPAEFRQIARDQLSNYPSIQLVEGLVTEVQAKQDQFEAKLQDGTLLKVRKVLFATGVVDKKPKLPRFDEFWGKTIHLCPYCDGWEHRDQAILVHGKGHEGFEFALEMLGWSKNLTMVTDGPSGLSHEDKADLEKSSIRLVETKIKNLEGENGQLTGVQFSDGTVLSCTALFFTAAQQQRSDIAIQLGCKLSEDGVTLDCKECASTNIPGVYVAGNTSRGLQLVIMAAADGTQAAFTINQALLDEECPV